MGESKQAKQISLPSLYLAWVCVQSDVKMVGQGKKKNITAASEGNWYNASKLHDLPELR